MEILEIAIKWSKDGKVYFRPDDHSYWMGERRLQGVTSFINQYKTPFDAPAQAKKYAVKHGLDADVVLAEWEAKGKESRESGTKVHSVFETYIETGRIVWEPGNMKQIVAVKFIKDYFMSGRLEPVECEMIVYGDKLASMIDLIARNEKNEYFIFDWKTSKEISRNGFNKFMAHPFDIHPDANFYHYSLQVSVYKQLCRDYDIKDCFITHISENNYEIIRALKIPIPSNLL